MPKPFTVPVPRVDAPSMNVNVPVRVLGQGKVPATVEENVTLAFRVDGFRFDARVVVGN
jgi:hypothetical protein